MYLCYLSPNFVHFQLNQFQLLLSIIIIIINMNYEFHLNY